MCKRIAAACNERAELVALRVAEYGDVGQDEGLVSGKLFHAEQPVMHHLERYARLDQRLVQAQRVVLDFGFGLFHRRRTTRSAASTPARHVRASVGA